MLGLPMELYTPIFAIARMVGWSAHRMEELATNSKIIRPAYKTLAPISLMWSCRKENNCAQWIPYRQCSFNHQDKRAFPTVDSPHVFTIV